MEYKIINRYKIKNAFLNKKGGIFFHVPKCGGLSLSHSLGVTLKHFRIMGAPALRDKKFEQSSQMIQKKINDLNELYNIKLDSYNAVDIYKKTKHISETFPFISGHLPFSAYKNINNRLSFTVLRDPISRAKSNYLFFLQNHPDNTYTLEELYLKKILFPNQITSFFSSYNEPNINVSLENLKKIDLIADLNDIHKLLEYLISIFKLPNMILIKLNETRHVKNLKESELSVIEKYNALDISLFAQAKKSFYNFENVEKKIDKNNYYSLYTGYPFFNGKGSNIFNNEEVRFVFKRLEQM